MTARTNTSVRLSADERRRLLAWGPDLASAVRRVLKVAEAAKRWESRGDDAALIGSMHAELVDAMRVRRPVFAMRDVVRKALAEGHSVAHIARELGVTRQAVQWHAKRIREGA